MDPHVCQQYKCGRDFLLFGSVDDFATKQKGQLLYVVICISFAFLFCFNKKYLDRIGFPFYQNLRVKRKIYTKLT